MDNVAEQANAFGRMWSEMAGKMAMSAWSFQPGSSPPEAVRQMRSATFQAMSHSLDEYMRSPQMMEMLKESMQAAITFRKQYNDVLNRLHHETQTPAKQDIDALMLSIRHGEQRVLDRLEDLGTQMASLSQRLDALENGRPRGAAKKSSEGAEAEKETKGK